MRNLQILGELQSRLYGRNFTLGFVTVKQEMFLEYFLPIANSKERLDVSLTFLALTGTARVLELVETHCFRTAEVGVSRPLESLRVSGLAPVESIASA